jgi:succinate dehydrogenase / fumarate reductase flavoprotein subunit
MECTILTLLKNAERVAGAFGYEREKGQFKLFRAKSIVLATGGSAGHSRSQVIAGSTQVMANLWHITLGAELKDMEFVQFHPTGMIWPPSVRGILVTEGVRGEGGILLNRENQRFMFNEIPELYA